MIYKEFLDFPGYQDFIYNFVSAYRSTFEYFLTKNIGESCFIRDQILIDVRKKNSMNTSDCVYILGLERMRKHWKRILD